MIFMVSLAKKMLHETSVLFELGFYKYENLEESTNG